MCFGSKYPKEMFNLILKTEALSAMFYFLTAFEPQDGLRVSCVVSLFPKLNKLFSGCFDSIDTIGHHKYT